MTRTKSDPFDPDSPGHQVRLQRCSESLDIMISGSIDSIVQLYVICAHMHNAAT